MTDFQTTLDYFYSLIDDNGIVQFSDRSRKSVESGYAVEDQARALIVAAYLNDNEMADHLFQLLKGYRRQDYMLLLRHADGAYEPLLQDPEYREDASAEALWALGELYSRKPSAEVAEFAEFIIDKQIHSIYSRSTSYALLGAALMQHQNGVVQLSDKLLKLYRAHADENWRWFEPMMTYGNALMPWSLLAAYQVVSNEEYLEVALESLDFLYDHLHRGAIPVLVGNNTANHWWSKGSVMPLFDQQPIDASYMCMASLKAYEITKKDFYLDKARLYYSWFMGNNLHSVSMIRQDGGCCDGLDNIGLNPNSGAESTVCYMIATLQLAEYDRGII